MSRRTNAARPRLGPKAAEVVRRRLDRLEGTTDRFKGVTLDDWEYFLAVVLPEVYGEPPSSPPAAAPPGTKEKYLEMGRRADGGLKLFDPGDESGADAEDGKNAGYVNLLGSVFATDEERAAWRASQNTAANDARAATPARVGPAPFGLACVPMEDEANWRGGDESGDRNPAAGGAESYNPAAPGYGGIDNEHDDGRHARARRVRHAA